MTDQQFVDNIIAFIETAENPESITNEMVAVVLNYINEGYKDLLPTKSEITKEAIAREAADNAIKKTIETIQLTIQTIINNVTAAKNTADENTNRINTLLGKNASTAIENFNEIIKFLDGFKDSETLVSHLDELSRRATRHDNAINSINVLPFNGIYSGKGVRPRAGVWFVDGAFVCYDDSDFYGFGADAYNEDAIDNPQGRKDRVFCLAAGTGILAYVDDGDDGRVLKYLATEKYVETEKAALEKKINRVADDLEIFKDEHFGEWREYANGKFKELDRVRPYAFDGICEDAVREFSKNRPFDVGSIVFDNTNGCFMEVKSGGLDSNLKNYNNPETGEAYEGVLFYCRGNLYHYTGDSVLYKLLDADEVEILINKIDQKLEIEIAEREFQTDSLLAGKIIDLERSMAEQKSRIDALEKRVNKAVSFEDGWTAPTYTRTSTKRALKSFTLTNGARETTFTVNQQNYTTIGSKLVFDLTGDAPLIVKPGDNIRFTEILHNEIWAMHGYLYIDYNCDGGFNSSLNTVKNKDYLTNLTGYPLNNLTERRLYSFNNLVNPTETGELVTFSAFNIGENDLVPGSCFVNSKGQTVDFGTSLHADLMPSFTLPQDLKAGTYRALFKVDWSNLDQHGASDIGDNGGCFVLFNIYILTSLS